VHGKLLEQNPKLTANPDLARTDAEWSGYLCLVIASQVQMSLIHAVHDESEFDLFASRPRHENEEDEKQQLQREKGGDGSEASGTQRVDAMDGGDGGQSAGSRVSDGFGGSLDNAHHKQHAAANRGLLTPNAWQQLRFGCSSSSGSISGGAQNDAMQCER
jgi:hypothetical protein